MPSFLKSKPKIEQLIESDPYGYALHDFKVRFSLVGPVSAGKSSLAAGLVVAANSMSSTMKNFYCRVLPKSSYILTDASNLRAGRFPARTDPYNPVTYEAGIIIGDRNNKKTMQIPISDTGGEVLDALALRTPTMEQHERIKNINRNVVKHIRESQGFILALPAPEALIFRTGYAMQDVDSYVYTVLSDIMDFKLFSGTVIDGVAIWVTKSDEVLEEAANLGMNLLHPEGMMRFLDNGFPNTMMLLKPLREAGKVQLFRSFFTIQRRDDGSLDLWEDGNKKIKILDDPSNYVRFKPEFAELDSVKFIQWAASFAK